MLKNANADLSAELSRRSTDRVPIRPLMPNETTFGNAEVFGWRNDLTQPVFGARVSVNCNHSEMFVQFAYVTFVHTQFKENM